MAFRLDDLRDIYMYVSVVLRLTCSRNLNVNLKHGSTNNAGYEDDIKRPTR